MRKRIWIPLLTAILLAAVAAGCLLPGILSETPSPATEPATEQTSATVPQPNPYLYHYFMGAINRGDCRRLQGTVLLTFFLVSDAQSRWTADAVQNLKQVHEKSIALMTAEAASYGVTLEVTTHYVLCSIQGSMSRPDYAKGVQEALASLGYSDPEKVCAALEAQFEVDDAAVLFCMNRQERSFAVVSKNLRGFEYGMLYGKKEDFRHELYHLYGAKDLYPASVKSVGEKYFPTSVMLDSSLVMDDLNAYLIGWTNTLSQKAIAFLEETKHINAGNFKGDTD